MSDASTSPTRSPNAVIEHDADIHTVAEHDPKVNNANKDSGDVQHGRDYRDAVDAVHRSHHLDSGLDVSEDVEEEGKRFLRCA